MRGTHTFSFGHFFARHHSQSLIGQSFQFQNMKIITREKLLGSSMALTSAFFYCGMFFAIQYGGTNPIDFHMYRSFLLVLIFLLPKLCQENSNILPEDAKTRVRLCGHWTIFCMIGIIFGQDYGMISTRMNELNRKSEDKTS